MRISAYCVVEIVSILASVFLFAAAINHKDGTQLNVVYNDPAEGTVYLTDIFGNSQAWIEARVAKLTERWVDPGTGQVRHPVLIQPKSLLPVYS